MEKAITRKGTVQSPPLGAGGLDSNAAALRLKKVVHRTPLQRNTHLSKKYECNIFLKREFFILSIALLLLLNLRSVAPRYRKISFNNFDKLIKFISA